MSRMAGLPETERARRHQSRRWRPSNALIGAAVIVLAIVGPYLAFLGHVPFTSRGYQLEATFRNAIDIATGSPVRVAGVNVGEVTATESDGDNTTVRFTIEDEGRPVSADATAKIRPRLFFEGNWFVDLEPGTPDAPEMESGDAIPVSHTATAVQFDEVLTGLQKPTRDDLGELLSGYGGSLTHEPTPVEDRTQDPRVRGKTAATALNMAFDHGRKAGRASAQVSEAFRGTEPRDLRRLIAGSARTLSAFADRDAELRELVTNFSRFTGALAAESENLARTVDELAPTLAEQRESLANLNRSLPPLRAWARKLEPALAELPATIEAAGPWLEQARPAVSSAEAGAIARLLRRATPGLAGASRAGIDTIRQMNRLGLCTSEVLVPTGDQEIRDRFGTGGPNYREFFYAASNIAGESQNFDGNGAFLRLQAGGGGVPVTTVDLRPNRNTEDFRTVWGYASAPPLGTQPQFGPKPPFRPDVKCHTNNPPDLNSGLGVVGPPSPKTVDQP